MYFIISTNFDGKATNVASLTVHSTVLDSFVSLPTSGNHVRGTDSFSKQEHLGQAEIPVSEIAATGITHLVYS